LDISKPHFKQTFARFAPARATDKHQFDSRTLAQFPEACRIGYASFKATQSPSVVFAQVGLKLAHPHELMAIHLGESGNRDFCQIV
jgi:hypothetical protein